MKIDDYSFGRIRIGGREYTSDVIVFPGMVAAGWRRKEGHALRLEDLAEVLREPPGILVVGTGHSGALSVPRETLDALRERGIDVRIFRTTEAVSEFNRLIEKGANPIAALHLTC